jgi:hypothetical protein
VRLTAEGEAMFLRLRRAAAAFDGLLRASSTTPTSRGCAGC